MTNIYNFFYPVCFISIDNLLFFKRGIFYIFDITSSRHTEIGRMRLSFKEKLIYLIPLFPRLLRMGIRCSMKISDDIVLFVFNKTIYELDIHNGSISAGYKTNNKSRPMSFSEIIGISGFGSGIYFGEYLNNPEKKQIGIYKRISRDNWTEVYKFKDGMIEHIHLIVADKYNDCVFIFTGDFDHSSGIWIANDNFSSVNPILTGKQKYRSCVAFPTSQGLIYATDSPFTDNTIRVLTKDIKGNWISKKKESINGPSIFGCEWNNDFVFSTSVEGDGRNPSIFYKLFGRSRGIGIKSEMSCIYKGNLEDGFNIIYMVKKDFLPFFLFQFGLLIFPSGSNKSKYLPAYHIATSKHSMSTLFIIE